VYLFNDAGEMVGYMTLAAKTLEEWEKEKPDFSYNQYATGEPDPPRTPPLDLKYGKFSTPDLQLAVEANVHYIRKSKGDKAAENFYRLAIAQHTGGDAALRAEWQKVFHPDEKPAA
jgi:hypothetical protein